MKDSSYVPDNITSLLSSPIEIILNTNVIILESDRFVDEATKLMKDRNTRSVLASHNGEVIGILSKTDILFKVISQGRNPSKIKLREIMTSPVLAVDPKTSVQEALSIMDKNDVRQIIVSSNAAVLGMVSRDDIFEKIQMATISTADTALRGTPVCIINPKAIVYMKDNSSANLTCPYCDSPFDTKEALSKHIDRLHAGTGILEGDMRRMFE
ncbi:MAG TPA: CBS domain-containing protein [Nitrososphaeraceae archaeon]|nr:CBS domain-containing protein [Nitrososphaeraceae archaeon]